MDPPPTPHLSVGSGLTVALASVLLALAITCSVYRFSLPTDGWKFRPEQRNYVTHFVFDRSVFADISPLESGDQLLAVEGQPVQDMVARALAGQAQLPAN